jgi:hypothetical protein
MADDRQSPRKVAKANLVILMEPNNAATVLNVSDEGIGFRADRPLAQSGKIRFSFPENGRQIETSGELVWTDSTKQIGGLSFRSLPEEERELIRRWANQGDKPATSTRPAYKPAPPPPKEPPRPFVAPTRTNAESIPSFTLPAVPMPQFPRPGFPQFESVPQRLGYAWEREMPIADSRPKFFRGFLVGVIVSAILGGVLFFVHGNSIKDLQGQLSELIGASPKMQAAPAAIPPAAFQPAAIPPPLVASGSAPSGGVTEPATSGQLPASGDDPKTESAPPKIARESSMANKHFTPASESSPPKIADPGAEDLALAQRYLTTMPGHTGSATATRYLWAAVEKGNVQAEITLADMYARGEGVTKNCNQAQVLLRAASKKGNNQASQELAQLIRIGCR